MTEVLAGALAAALDRLLTRTVDHHRGVRHGLLAVADVGGSWIWQGAHGVADPDGTPISTATRYPVASVTKLYTMVVVMRLVEQDSITLGDRIVDLLPADITDGLHVLDGVDDTPAITVEHLLSHTSGLPDYYEEAPPGGRSPQERLLAGEDAPVPFDEVLQLVRDELTPHFPPQPVDASRRRATYADTNFQLLGAVVEAVAGKPLRTVFDETLFRPLRLDDTSSYPQRPRSGAAAEPQAAVWSGKVVGHSGSTASWLFHCPQLRIITAGTFDVAQPPLPFRFLPRMLRAVESSDPRS